MSAVVMCLACAAFGIGVARADETQPQQRPTLYVTATAHLDTQWLWTIQDTIDKYIPSTLRGNFPLFEKFPNYTFSFEGAFRYMLAKEYYPEEYAKLKEYVARGRWSVCGSTIDAGDVNVPSPESLIRQVLYGNGFFEREFGKTSCDIYLPDCFGFGYALPSVAAHCGLRGFSTQKLTWGSSVGIPFDIGLWEGVDGSTVIAALNPGEYVSKIRADLSTDEKWLERITELGGQSGAYVGYKYFGVGDRGGAPDEESVEWLEKAIAGDGPIRVVSAPADQLFRDLTPQQIAGLPRYKGELLMTRHGVGCYTSQAPMKRWNRKNEQLADATERACVLADWLGGIEYPKEKLREAWIRFLWHQFHDDLTGTSIPRAYTFSWNDEIIALNQFAAEYKNAIGAAARILDTRVEGVPVVVFNPLAFEREDVVEVTVRFPDGAPEALRVYDAAGGEVASQVMSIVGSEVRLLFRARVLSVGLEVFDVRPSAAGCRMPTGLAVSESSLESRRYRVRLDENGDVSSIFDYFDGRELLSGPVRLELRHNKPQYWSEWEIRYEDIVAEPYEYVDGPATVRVVESGPVRATIEVTRKAAGSTFVQRISLASGAAGDRVEFDTLIDWHTPATHLKASFPLTVSNETATYDLGFGVIERPTNTEKKYEVPAQQWADLTAGDGSFGTAIMNDCKYGWDKPDDHTLRLTLIHSPNDVEKDMGFHKMVYAVSGHRGDWRNGRVIQQAARLNQPMAAFQAPVHPGEQVRRLSFMDVFSPQVVVRALKRAEKTDEIIVRLQEAHGKEAKDVRVGLLGRILSAREVNGMEQTIGDAEIRDGRLYVDFAPYKPRAFALTLAGSPKKVAPPVARAVSLPFDLDVVSFDRDKSDGDFDGEGHTLPAELLPAEVTSAGVPFVIGPTAEGENNAIACRGQTIALPEGDFNRLYVLAGSVGGSAGGTFTVGETTAKLSVHEFTGFLGQSQSLFVDDRLVEAREMAPAFIHRDEVAWVGTHRHDAATGSNEAYVFCYLFKYGMDLPTGATSVTLPDNERIRIMAMTVANNPNDATTSAHELYDRITGTYIKPFGGVFINPVMVSLSTDLADGEIVYTVDGTDPAASSSRYRGSFLVTGSATVAARPIRRGVLGERITRATFTITRPREPDGPADAAPGLDYRYYEGKWKELPDFEALTLAGAGTVATFDLAPKARDDAYGFVFSGFVEVPRDGVYTFYTSSDDGSRLYIGDVGVVDNDGLHGKREKSGKIGLKAGLHGLRVTYFESGVDDVLEVRFAGPGTPKQPIPASALFRVGAGEHD